MQIRRNLTPATLKAWKEDSEKLAFDLLTNVTTISDDLFSSGDPSDFLILLSRFPHYHVYNLLLLLLQFPNASCLATKKFWRGQMSDSSMPLMKPIWEGKEIDLLAPYTANLRGIGFSLYWAPIQQIDLSQTNVEGYTPPEKGYLRDDRHLSLLLDSIQEVIRQEYHYSIVSLPPSQETQVTKVHGTVTGRVVQLREDISLLQKVTWLAQTLCSFAMPESSFSESQKDYAQKCAFHCLSLIWGIDSGLPLHSKRNVLATIDPSSRIDFLKLIQTPVRHIDDSVLFHYKSFRQASDDLDDLDIVFDI